MIIELKIGTQSLKVDKELLARYSDYFDAMFTSPFSEQSSDVITLKHINFRSVKVIVDYIYSGKLVLSPFNIEDVFLTADFLQIPTVRQRCLELFGKHLAPNNCINIYKLSVQHGLKNTERSAVRIIMKCFEEIYEDSDYLDFSSNLLFYLLSDCDLNISQEIFVFNAIERWIGHDPVSRKFYKEELLCCVMVDLLSNQELHKVITSDLVKNSPDVKQHYKEILSTSSRDLSGKRRNFKGGKGLGKERLGMINGRVYIIGGLADTKVPSDVEVFIPHHTKISRDPNTFVRNTFTPVVDDVTKTHSDDVTVMPSQPPVVTVECGGRNVTRSYGGGATVVDGAVYLVGGRSDSGVSDKLYQLELHSQRYKEVGKVPVWCDHVTVTSSDKKVFVIGGYQLSETASLTPSSQVQIYDTASQEWKTGPELSVPRAHATSIGINSGGGLASRVIVLGGYGTNKLSSVELITDGVSVENMPPMLKPRHAFCAAMVEGTIIALGGWNERTVEKYDFRNKQWSLLKDFPKQRDCIQGEVCEGVLYVFGGVKKNKNVSTIEKYDYESDGWRTVGQFMVPRLYSAVVVT